MAQPLYFEPDPSIDDSELLGYGNLLLDNGTSQWINGEPDIATSYPRAPERQGHTVPDAPTQPDMTGVQDPNTGALLDPGEPATNPVAPLAKVGSAFADTMRGVAPPGQQGPLNPSPMQPVPIPGTPHSVDPSTGDIIQGGADEQSGALPGTQTSQMQPVPIPGTPHAVDPSTGNIIQGGAQSGYGTGGLQLEQREGALPQDVAAQQASERETLNTNEMLATSTGRQRELDIYRQAALQRQGQLDAEKAAKQKELDEQQAKMSRLQQEQRTTADMDIKTDLVSAEGSIGSVFSILGAAMLGAVHSDAGLRMIDNTIDTNVRKQMSQRDSKLKILADQLNSSEQAVAAGKAALYKIAADKVEATQQLTKADVFEAQTPAILAGLRQKQQLAEQAFVDKSLGKTLEKAPATPQPKAIDVEKYGKLAAEQAQQEKNIERAANAIGLVGWDPKSGTFANRDEVLKNGIPGVGKADTFLQGVPGLRNLDTMVTSKEGQKIRAALEGLVAAEAKAQNPGRAPTDADRDAARITLGLTTEEGTVAAIERLMGQQQQYKAQNAAAFGNAAGTYENRIDQMGARPPQQNGPVDMGQPLEPGKARQQLEQERARKPAAGPGAGPQSDAGGFIQKEEGFRSQAYQDQAGNWTIGFGHTGPEVKEGMKITREEASQLMAKDMATAEHAVLDHVDVPLDDPQKQALVSLAYNIGPEAFAKSTLVRKLNDGDYAGAAVEFYKWNKITRNGVKQESPDLIRRRNREEALFSGQG